MAKQQVTLRTQAGDTRTIELYTPLPATITVNVAPEKHNTGINATIDAHYKKFGSPRTFQWDAVAGEYVEIAT